MKYIRTPLSLKLDLPPEILGYLESLGYIEVSNSFSGDLCIKSYSAKKEFNDMIISLIIKDKDGDVL